MPANLVVPWQQYKAITVTMDYLTKLSITSQWKWMPSIEIQCAFGCSYFLCLHLHLLLFLPLNLFCCLTIVKWNGLLKGHSLASNCLFCSGKDMAIFLPRVDHDQNNSIDMFFSFCCCWLVKKRNCCLKIHELIIVVACYVTAPYRLSLSSKFSRLRPICPFIFQLRKLQPIHYCFHGIRWCSRAIITMTHHIVVELKVPGIPDYYHWLLRLAKTIMYSSLPPPFVLLSLNELT